MSNTSTLRALGVAFPETVRTNDWWEQHHPDLVRDARAATLARVWAPTDAREPSAYDRAFAPYERDPFRGVVERRVLADGEGAVDLEARALSAALSAAGLEPDALDLVLLAALRPDTHVVGDGAFLARRMGLRVPVIGFETACSSALVGLELAFDLAAAGRHRRIGVVVACTYSRDADLSDSFSWFLGDGAGAFIVAAGGAGADLLGAATVPTVESCGAFRYALEANRLVLRPGDGAGRIIRDMSPVWLRRCVDGALAQAGVRLADIDAVVVNTPTAWYGRFCANELGIDPERVIDTHPRYANCGPALLPVNLHAADRTGRLRPGGLVLLYSVGSVSTASAAVLRWGDVAVGGVA